MKNPIREIWTQARIWRVSQFALIVMTAFVYGCSTMERSVTFGVMTGAAAGTGVGLMVGGQDQAEAALISAGIGAAVGGVASYLIHGGLSKRDETVRRQTLFNLGEHGIELPSSKGAGPSDVNGYLTMPEVEEDWVDTHTEGNKLIEAHRVWLIQGGATWDLSKKTARKKGK